MFHKIFLEITSLSMGSPNTKAALSLLATGALCLLRPATSFLPATHPAGQMLDVMYSSTEATATSSRPTHWCFFPCRIAIQSTTSMV